ncbi:MAG: HAMP domain-containing sensor histidine kinase [Actinomycetota bacterium]
MTTHSAPAPLRRPPLPAGIDAAARVFVVLIAAGVGAFAAHAVFGVGKPQLDALFLHVIYDGIWVAAAVAILVRAATRAAERLSWTLAGLGVACAAASAVAYSVEAPETAQGVLRLATYPLLCAGILTLARGERGARLRDILLDALPAALAVGGLMAMTLVPRIEGASEATSQAVAFVAAAVGGDILVASCAVALFIAMARVRWTSAVWLLGAAGLFAAAADAILLIQSANLTYVPGGPWDLLWPLSALSAAAAPWIASSRKSPAPRPDRVDLPMLLGVAVISVVGIGYAGAEGLGWALAPSVAGLTAAVARAYGHARAEMERVRREEETLREADRFKSALLGGLSHELLAPLTAIGVAAERIPVTRSEERLAEFGGLIREEASRAERFIRAVLELSRAEAGGLKPTLRVTGVFDVVDDAVAAARVEVGDLDIAINVDEALEVRADPSLASRIVVNLLQNAARHGAGPVRISANGDASRVSIVVEDAGGGVSPEHRDTLFRVAPPPSGPGLGVGLALSRALARAQGGELVYAPRDGVPGRFVLSLPRGAS